MNEVKVLEDKEVLSRNNLRQSILSFEERMSKIPGVKFGDMDECPLTHTFADGVYVRTICIPKGMLVVGKIHRHSHPNFLLQGDVTVITEDGGVQRLRAPLPLISKAGTKRIVFAHENTVWTTVHVTKETDLDKIEEEIIAKSYEELDSVISIENNVMDKMIETIQSEVN